MSPFKGVVYVSIREYYEVSLPAWCPCQATLVAPSIEMKHRGEKKRKEKKRKEKKRKEKKRKGKEKKGKKRKEKKRKEKKRKDKTRQDNACWRQFDEKPSILPGCPGTKHILFAMCSSFVSKLASCWSGMSARKLVIIPFINICIQLIMS